MFDWKNVYKSIQIEKSILGVGPVSKNTIDATIEVANDYQIPMFLIGSRRQVECARLGKGYVAETKELVDYVKSKDKGNYIAIARDHGGPWQGTDEYELGYYDALERSLTSYYQDIEAGFDILHIDPSLKSRPIEKVIEDAKFIYQECEKYAKDLGKEIVYEVGTEEHSGNIHGIEDFEKFVKEIKSSCPKVKFVVGNTGLWVKEDRNVGKFDSAHTRELVRVCNENDAFLKAHNVDYTGLAMPLFGVHSCNVAPEFGVVETRVFLANLSEEDKNKFIDIAFNSMKWVKWMIDEPGEKSKQHKAELCGHYVFNNPEVLAMRTPEIDNKCKKAIKSLILGYLYDFGWSVDL